MLFSLTRNTLTLVPSTIQIVVALVISLVFLFLDIISQLFTFNNVRNFLQFIFFWKHTPLNSIIVNKFEK